MKVWDVGSAPETVATESEDRVTLARVLEIIGASRYPARWQSQIVRHERFPKPIGDTWSLDEVLKWKSESSGRAAHDSVSLTREELEDDGIMLSDELIAEILKGSGSRCQCERAHCHGSTGIHGLPLRAPRLRVFPMSGRWAYPPGPASVYGVLCVECGKRAPWKRWRETMDDALEEVPEAWGPSETVQASMTFQAKRQSGEPTARFAPTRKGSKPPPSRRR